MAPRFARFNQMKVPLPVHHFEWGTSHPNDRAILPSIGCLRESPRCNIQQDHRHPRGGAIRNLSVHAARLAAERKRGRDIGQTIQNLTGLPDVAAPFSRANLVHAAIHQPSAHRTTHESTGPCLLLKMKRMRVSVPSHAHNVCSPTQEAQNILANTPMSRR